MHRIRDLAQGRVGTTAARLRKPLTATLLAVGLVIALSASAVARTASMPSMASAIHIRRHCSPSR
jgi:hypothetical protein